MPVQGVGLCKQGVGLHVCEALKGAVWWLTWGGAVYQ